MHADPCAQRRRPRRLAVALPRAGATAASLLASPPGDRMRERERERGRQRERPSWCHDVVAQARSRLPVVSNVRFVCFFAFFFPMHMDSLLFFCSKHSGIRPRPMIRLGGAARGARPPAREAGVQGGRPVCKFSATTLPRGSAAVNLQHSVPP